MANRLFSPDEQFCDQNGLPYAGGTLSFYASGTSTPLSTFSNQALSSPNTNPVVLDSAGRAGAIFLQSLSYKVILADVNSNQIWVQDPVYSSDFSVVAQFQVFAGNPNGNVAGTAGSGTTPSSAVWDTTDNLLYICTTTGTTTTAVWTAVNTTSLLTTGDVKWRASTDVIAGWVRANALTVGNSTSGATERANTDTSALYSYLWNNFTNTQCPVSTGRGANSTADFTASKTIQVLDMRSLSPIGLDTMGNSAASLFTGVPFVSGNSTTAAAVAGENVHTLLTTELPASAPTFTGTPQTWSTTQTNVLVQSSLTINPGSGTGLLGQTSQALTTAVTPAGTISNLGSGTAHNTVQRSMLGIWYLKL